MAALRQPFAGRKGQVGGGRLTAAPCAVPACMFARASSPDPPPLPLPSSYGVGFVLEIFYSLVQHCLTCRPNGSPRPPSTPRHSVLGSALAVHVWWARGRPPPPLGARRADLDRA